MPLGLPTKDTLEWVTLAAAISAGAYRYGFLRVLRKVRSFRESWSALADNHLALSEVTMRIEKELRPNGGTSLRDAVNRIDRRLISLDTDLRVMREMQRVIASAPAGAALFETNGHGECDWVNERWVQMSGAPAESSNGWGWLNAVHQDDRERVLEEWRVATEQHRAFLATFRLCSAITGVCQTVRCHALPVLGDGATVLGFVAVATPLAGSSFGELR